MKKKGLIFVVVFGTEKKCRKMAVETLYFCAILLLLLYVIVFELVFCEQHQRLTPLLLLLF